LSYYYENTSLSTVKNKALRIELTTDQSEIDISANGGFFVIDEKTRGKIVAEPTGSAWKVTRDLDGSFLITRPDNSSGGSYGGPIRFEPIKKDGSTIFKLINNNHRYRGYLTIAPESGSLSKSRVINKIMLEDYLRGIAEIPYSWPIEALKAQVVAARSYASRRIGKPRDFDMYADDRDQVYSGYDQEIANGGSNWISAVTSTNGLVATYRGRVINAYYFSTCGGSTENIENVWKKYSPYLRAVKCNYCQESPKYSWSRRFSAAEITDGLNSKPETTVKGKLAGLEVMERSGTSRVKLIRIKGTGGIVDTTGEKFRSALGLNSTMFNIRRAITH
jgi:stage II sporulation protein D